MMETLHKALRSVHLYDVVDANVLLMNALKKFEVCMAELPRMFSEFSASAGAVFQAQLPVFTGRSTAI